MKTYKRKMTAEELRQLLDLRNGSRSSLHANKKKYSRRRKKDRRYEY